MVEARDRRAARATEYYFRRRLSLREQLPAVAVGVGVGLAAFYVARLFLERTPLRREAGVPVVSRRGAIVRRPVTRGTAG